MTENAYDDVRLLFRLAAAEAAGEISESDYALRAARAGARLEFFSERPNSKYWRLVDAAAMRARADAIDPPDTMSRMAEDDPGDRVVGGPRSRKGQRVLEEHDRRFEDAEASGNDDAVNEAYERLAREEEGLYRGRRDVRLNGHPALRGDAQKMAEGDPESRLGPRRPEFEGDDGDENDPLPDVPASVEEDLDRSARNVTRHPRTSGTWKRDATGKMRNRGLRQTREEWLTRDGHIGFAEPSEEDRQEAARLRADSDRSDDNVALYDPKSAGRGKRTMRLPNPTADHTAAAVYNKRRAAHQRAEADQLDPPAPEADDEYAEGDAREVAALRYAADLDEQSARGWDGLSRRGDIDRTGADRSKARAKENMAYAARRRREADRLEPPDEGHDDHGEAEDYETLKKHAGGEGGGDVVLDNGQYVRHETTKEEYDRAFAHEDARESRRLANLVDRGYGIDRGVAARAARRMESWGHGQRADDHDDMGERCYAEDEPGRESPAASGRRRAKAGLDMRNAHPAAGGYRLSPAARAEWERAVTHGDENTAPSQADPPPSMADLGAMGHAEDAPIDILTARPRREFARCAEDDEPADESSRAEDVDDLEARHGHGTDAYWDAVENLNANAHGGEYLDQQHYLAERAFRNSPDDYAEDGPAADHCNHIIRDAIDAEQGDEDVSDEEANYAANQFRSRAKTLERRADGERRGQKRGGQR